ncbi:hypothetical protein [Streptosporangium sp. NPDC023615]|uniref:hypothetical protein n=1 Tax=Streptosporangium sp. NPDC023615 TaxID=3154794 RepID=UPI003438898F
MRSPKRLTRVPALVLLTTLAAACGGPVPPRPSPQVPTPAPPTASPPMSPTASPTVSAVLEPRPLRLPVVRAGARCPTTSPRPWSGPGEASRVLGDGPVYPIADYFMKGGAVLDLRPEDREPDGSYVKKVRWVVADYTGPVLIRAARVDGKGTASARFSYTGERRDGGYHADLTMPRTSVPGTTTVGGPGCYAYQIDGTTFSTVVVFGAVKVGAADEPSS